MPVAHHFCSGAHLILPIVAALLSILRAQPGWSERGGRSGSGIACATFFPMLLQMQTGLLRLRRALVPRESLSASQQG